MKKLVIISFAAVAALAACTKVENTTFDEEHPITFNVVSYQQQTRANSAYSVADVFGTFAYWTATDWATDGDANVFMDNEKIVYGPSYALGEWGPENKYYWTKTGAITFASYSPYVSGAEKGFSAVPFHSKSSGFRFPAYTIQDATNVDVMVADLRADQTANAPEYTLSSNSDGVPTLFRHVLTQVAIQFKVTANHNANVDGSEVVLHEVKITDIKNKGDYTQTASPVWTGQTGAVEYEFNPATGNDITMVSTATEPYKPQVESRILLPQDLLATDTVLGVAGQKLEVSYTIRTHYKSQPAGTWAEENVSSVIDLTSTAIPSWSPNMSIVYNITLSPFSDVPVLFDPAIAPWTSVEGSFTVYPD